MNCAFIEKTGNEIKFSMEFSAKEFEDEQIEVYKKTKHQFKIDGFRNGKAPKRMVEMRYGEKIFFEDAVSNLFAEHYESALTELALEPLGRPGIEVGEISKGNGFTATVRVTVAPEIVVKDYKGIKVKNVDFPVSDEDVDAEIEKLRKRNARLVVAERPAESGDSLIFDYAGFIGEEQFEGGTAENATLVLGGGNFIPGFEEQLIGAKAGDERDVKVTFPEEYHAEELAGKDAVFRCKVHEVKEEEKPEIDDDFAQDVSDFDTVEELKSDIRRKLEEEAESKRKQELFNRAVEKLLAANDVDIPNVMVEEQIDQMFEELGQRFGMRGADFMKNMESMNENLGILRDNLRSDAHKRVKLSLLIRAIAKAEKLEASAEEIEESRKNFIKTLNAESGELVDQIMKTPDSIFEDSIIADKAKLFLVDNVVISEDADDDAAEVDVEKNGAAGVTAEKGGVAEAAAETGGAGAAVDVTAEKDGVAEAAAEEERGE
ncbi:MAG: trigger factor [Clostridiales Family XIII bacterium]|jgi:trigger factor|nr:trigger factor [Clostridiales Family XIII bacterium]